MVPHRVGELGKSTSLRILSKIPDPSKSLDVEVLLNHVADAATNSTNHSEKHVHLERYSYSGEGLEGHPFKEGETVWEVSFKPYGVYDTTDHGYGYTIAGAALDAAKSALVRQKRTAEEQLRQSTTSAQTNKEWLDRILADEQALTKIGGSRP